MKKKIFFISIMLILLAVLSVGGYFLYNKLHDQSFVPRTPSVVSENKFNANIIRAVNAKEENNYLISPYSIEIALNMLRDGANGETKEQIDKVLENRQINNLYIKNRINVANAAFIKNEYKNNVVDSYYKSLKNKYNADILYDEYKTPKVMNGWVNKQTKGMIKSIKDDISPDFAMGIANAVAIDVEWEFPFECNYTRKGEFTKYNNEEYDVSMMHETYQDAIYFDTAEEQGIVLPYKTYNQNGKETNNGDKLEFIGILPKKDIKEYVNNIDQNTFNRIDDSMIGLNENEKLRLSLPMFKYKYKIGDFIATLNDLGIIDVFDSTRSDLSNMIKSENPDENFYVSDAIHKTYIELNEKGTKAAAVTAFLIEKSSAVLDESKIIEINFNKPFAYMIRDSKTKEILFFGVVYEPSSWKGSTCK